MFNFLTNRRKRKLAQAACDAFNAKHPTPRRVTYSIAGRQPVETETLGKAYVLDGQAVAVIDVRAFMGCVLLENITPCQRQAPSRLAPSYHRPGECSRTAAPMDSQPYAGSSWPFTAHHDSSPSWTRAADPEPAMASGGGGNFGGGGASGSWGDSSGSSSSSSDSSSSSSSSSSND